MVATLETEKRNWPFIIMVIVFFSVVFYFNVVLLSAQSRFIESCILQKDLLSILQIVIKINITPISVVTPIFLCLVFYQCIYALLYKNKKYFYKFHCKHIYSSIVSYKYVSIVYIDLLYFIYMGL
jgi:hypothetical protein